MQTCLSPLSESDAKVRCKGGLATATLCAEYGHDAAVPAAILGRCAAGLFSHSTADRSRPAHRCGYCAQVTLVDNFPDAGAQRLVKYGGVHASAKQNDPERGTGDAQRFGKR